MAAARSLKPDHPVPDVTWLIPGTLPRGQLVLLDGPAGVGKSCLAAALVAGITHYHALAPDETILYFSSDRQRDLITTFLARQEANFDRIRDIEFTLEPEVEKSKNHWLHKFLELLSESIKQHKPALIVIDSIEELYEKCPEAEAEYWRGIWHCLHVHARAYNCTILVTRQHGLHENRQYGTLTRCGSEIARFALTMHYHPTDPVKRVITLAKNQFGAIGQQSLGRFYNNQLALIRLESHEYVRPSRTVAPWLPSDPHQEETDEIVAVVETFLDGKPAPKQAIMEHVVSQGYSQRAYKRVMGRAKLQSSRMGARDWYFIPTTEMFSRTMELRRNAAQTEPQTPRAQGAAVDQKTQPITAPKPLQHQTETRQAG